MVVGVPGSTLTKTLRVCPGRQGVNQLQLYAGRKIPHGAQQAADVGVRRAQQAAQFAAAQIAQLAVALQLHVLLQQLAHIFGGLTSSVKLAGPTADGEFRSLDSRLQPDSSSALANKNADGNADVFERKGLGMNLF